MLAYLVRSPRALGAAAFLAAASTSAHSGVLVVDPAGGPGVDHTTIQAAVDAALSGDTILVRAGVYGGLGIHDKGVSVIADRGADVRLTNEIAVRHLSAGEQVHLIGLDVQSVSATNRGLVASDNAGVIWVEGCKLAGAPGNYDDFGPGAFPGPGVLALDSDDLILIRCIVRGGDGKDGPLDMDDPGGCTPGAHALLVDNSSVTVFEGQLRGGKGGSEYDWYFSGCGGGDGVRLEAGSPHSCFLEGVSLRGGRGGDGGWDWFGACGSGGPGGDCILSPAGEELYYKDCTLVPGLGGNAWNTCSDGSPGDALAPATSTAVSLPGPARSLSIPSPASSGGAETLLAQGEPGDLCWAQVAPPLAPEYLPVISSMSLIGLPRRLLFMGVLDGTGDLVRQLPMPTLGMPTDSYEVHLQGYFRDVSGGSHLGSGSHLLILGSAF